MGRRRGHCAGTEPCLLRGRHFPLASHQLGDGSHVEQEGTPSLSRVADGYHVPSGLPGRPQHWLHQGTGHHGSYLHSPVHGHGSEHDQVVRASHYLRAPVDVAADVDPCVSECGFGGRVHRQDRGDACSSGEGTPNPQTCTVARMGPSVQRVHAHLRWRSADSARVPRGRDGRQGPRRQGLV